MAKATGLLPPYDPENPLVLWNFLLAQCGEMARQRNDHALQAILELMSQLVSISGLVIGQLQEFNKPFLELLALLFTEESRHFRSASRILANLALSHPSR
jgi:hypothetical protein